MEKAEFYKWVKIAGILSFLPITLAAGPVGGYFAGVYLEKRFGLPWYLTLILIGAGIIVSIKETVRIIMLVIKAEGSSHA